MESLLKNIKICGDPGCNAIFHNIPKIYTKCKDCGGRVISINEKTYWLKFAKNFFQYDFNTMEYYRPIKQKTQLQLNFD